MVNWKEKKILTVKEFDDSIEDRFEEAMKNANLYEEYLEEYLDSKYTKTELFKALTGDKYDIKAVIRDIQTGVSEAIYDDIQMDIEDNFEEIIVEV